MSPPAIPGTTLTRTPAAPDERITFEIPEEEFPPQVGAGLDAGYVLGDYSGFSGRLRGMLRFPLSRTLFADWDLTLGTRGLEDGNATRDGLRGRSTINYGLSLSVGGAIGYEFYEGLILSAGIDLSHQSLETSGLWRASGGEARDAGSGDLTSVGLPLRFAANIFRWIEADLSYTPRFFTANPDRAGRSFTGHELTLGLTMFWNIGGDDSDMPFDQPEGEAEPPPAPTAVATPPVEVTPPPAQASGAAPSPAAPAPPAPPAAPAPAAEPTVAAPAARPAGRTPPQQPAPGVTATRPPPSPPAQPTPAAPPPPAAPAAPAATALVPANTHPHIHDPIRYSGGFDDPNYHGRITGYCVVTNMERAVAMLRGTDAAAFDRLPYVLYARFSNGYLTYVIDTGKITPRNLGYVISSTVTSSPGHVVVSWQNAPASAQYLTHGGSPLSIFANNSGSWDMILERDSDGLGYNPPVYHVVWSARTTTDVATTPGHQFVRDSIIARNSRIITTAIYVSACRRMGEMPPSP